MCCVCDLEARLPPGFVVPGARSCSGPCRIIDQRAYILNAPCSDALTQLDGLREAPSADTRPPRRLADGDQRGDGRRGIGSWFAYDRGKAKVAGFGESVRRTLRQRRPDFGRDVHGVLEWELKSDPVMTGNFPHSRSVNPHHNATGSDPGIRLYAARIAC